VPLASPISFWRTIGEGTPQIVVQDLYAGLQQQVCAVTGPPHLLFLHKTLADHIAHGRFDKRRRNRLAVPITITVVRDKSLIGDDIGFFRK